MPTLKKQWDDLLEYSVPIAATLVILLSAVVLFTVFGAAIILAKLAHIMR